MGVIISDLRWTRCWLAVSDNAIAEISETLLLKKEVELKFYRDLGEQPPTDSHPTLLLLFVLLPVFVSSLFLLTWIATRPSKLMRDKENTDY